MNKCWCYRCDQKDIPIPNPNDPLNMLRMRMNLCPVCGNKRCPCGNSNESWQKGSFYD